MYNLPYTYCGRGLFIGPQACGFSNRAHMLFTHAAVPDTLASTH